MKFEYDPAKSASNKTKHGLDFEEAKALWADDNLLEVPVLGAGEERFLVIGAIQGKLWTGVITYRGGVVRIISVRRSRKTRLSTMSHDKISAEEFDRRFEAGEDISGHVDWNAARRPNRQTQRVNVDFPVWMVDSLDREAAHLGVSRQALVKVWIANCLARESHSLRRD